MPPIYLDHNSTTPLLDAVAIQMAQARESAFGNPSSQHAFGRRAHRVVEDAREQIATMLGGDVTRPHGADRFVFVSGGTEANNLAILGITAEWAAHRPRTNRAGRILISSIEHPSVSAAADFLITRGWQVDRLQTNVDGVVELAHLDELLAASDREGLPALVSVMLANNETGVIQPVKEIAARCAQYGTPVHTDAVQVVGKSPINFADLGVAAMTVTPHKFHGPLGIGGLLVRSDVKLQPLLHGAAQQFGLRPGTESPPLAVGFSTALDLANRDLQTRAARMTALRDRFEAEILKIYPHAVVNGQHAARLPHTSNIALVGHDRQALLMALDLAGVCCSTGSACSSGSSEPSPTLVAMRLPAEVIESSLRFSLGATTTEADIDSALERIKSVLQRTPTAAV